jgi:hypothetical protein
MKHDLLCPCCQRGHRDTLGTFLLGVPLTARFAGLAIFWYVWLYQALGDDPVSVVAVTGPRALYALIGRWSATVPLVGELVAPLYTVPNPRLSIVYAGLVPPLVLVG